MVGSGLMMEKTGDKLAKSSQQTDLYNYNLDHVYCSDNSRYRNAGTHLNLAAAASDLKSLRKENKQLQAMLLLHLDLIQEQSNQLIAKDKQLIQLREENAQLRLKCERNAANERRQNNNRYMANASGKVLNTSGGSPTIDSYFTTTTTEPKITQRPHYDTMKTKTLNTITSPNVLINNSNNSGQLNENQAIHEIRTSQTTFPIKIEVNTKPDEAKSHTNVLSDIGQAKDRYKVVTSISNSSNMANERPIPVKYRAIENNVIGHNNGKLISKIILQRKKSENGEKIFVRTKNIEIGSNNKVNYEKWSPLRTIKSEVVDNDTGKEEPVVLEPATASPKSNTAAIIDEEISSDVPDTSCLATSSADLSPPPSDQPPSDQLDDSIAECQVENIKIEQDLDDSQEESHHSPAYDPNDTLEDSQDVLNIESPQTSESIPAAPISSSPITSTVSTSDCNQSELFSANYLDSNLSMATGGTTILYPMPKRHFNRNAYLTTTKEYKTREWQLDEIELELKAEITDEICKEENEANLELPKWRTWEMSSKRDAPVCAREYEDLSDDAFTRRHARFLLDERKRKKWDVQRIREQRTIERLKRRHCKDELNQQKEFNDIYTFFPTVDQLKAIQITDEFPVSAFGEPIPLLPPSEFSLPWIQSQNDSLSTAADLTPRIEHFSGLPLPPDFTSRSNSNCSSVSLEPAPSNVSSIIFLSKKRAGRTRPSISHN